MSCGWLTSLLRTTRKGPIQTRGSRTAERASSLRADAESRHCTCRIAGSTLSETTRSPLLLLPSAGSGDGGNKLSEDDEDAPIAAATSFNVTVRCSTSSQRPPRPADAEANNATRPEQVDVVT